MYELCWVSVQSLMGQIHQAYYAQSLFYKVLIIKTVRFIYIFLWIMYTCFNLRYLDFYILVNHVKY